MQMLPMAKMDKCCVGSRGRGERPGWSPSRHLIFIMIMICSIWHMSLWQCVCVCVLASL